MESTPVETIKLYTRKTLFNLLPKKLERKAIRELTLQRRDFDAINDNGADYTSVGNALLSSFVFRETEEGGAFWRNAYQKYKHLKP